MRQEADNTSDSAAALESVAESLRHDIKSAIGTIGMNLLLAKQEFSSRKNVNPKIKKEFESSSKEWSQSVKSVYDAANVINQKVKSGQLKDEAVLARIIEESMMTPISMMINSIDGYIRQMKERPSKRSKLREARSAANRVQRILSALFNELSDVNHLKFQPTNLRSHMERAILQLSQQIQTTSTKIDISGTSSVKGDQASILVLFTNILENSIKYAKNDELPHIEVDIHDRLMDDIKEEYPEEFEKRNAPDKWAEISISDNGIGIPEEEREHVFDLGYRVGQKNVEGSGYGLFRAKTIVRRHRGKIVIESSESGGLEMRIFLPADPRATLS